MIHQTRPYSIGKVISGLILTCFFGISGIMEIWGKLGPNTLDNGLKNTKVVQSLQLHISHQIKPYPSVEAI